MTEERPPIRIEPGQSGLSGDGPRPPAPVPSPAREPHAAAPDASAPDGTAARSSEAIEFAGVRRRLGWAVPVVVVAALVAAAVVTVRNAGSGRGGSAAPGTSAGVVASTIPPGPPPTGAASLPRRSVSPPSTLPPEELVALRGRPPSPVRLDDAFCRAALQPGGLSPVDMAPWRPGSLPEPPALGDEQLRTEVATVMRRRFRYADPDQAVADAMSLLDSAALRYVTNDDLVLRAALVELKGTIGEPALRFVMATPLPVRIGFGPPPTPDVQVGVLSDGRSVEIVIREEDRNGPPELLAPLIFRELLHQGGSTSFDQALIERLLDDRVLLEELRDRPEALAPASVLAREARFAALSQLNTRVGSDMTAYRSDARILPNTDRDKYHSVVELLRDPGDSPDTAGLPEAPRSGSPTLTSVLASMTDDGSAPPSAGFDVPTLDFLDTHPGLGSCDQLVSAGALGVLPPGTAQDGAVAQYLAGGPLAS